MPTVLYELNEVPWRVVDWYVLRKPESRFAELLRGARTFTTVSSDEGELHPWSTWPSLHRGVPNTEHRISFINQEITTPFRPVWELLVEAGHSVGIFGSLQSYPRFPEDTTHYRFFVPDTFSPSPRTFPRRYEAFQRFNLAMTERDGAQAKEGIPRSPKLLLDGARMATTGLRPKTIVALASHLRAERGDARMRTRRSILQAPVAFDFFVDALKRATPDFATFFTNHVAGMMHRYWKYAFPEDFGEGPSADDVRSTNIEAAMDIADGQLGELMDFLKIRKGRLLVASSMGQEAIDRGEYLGEIRITSAARFLGAIGFLEPHRVNLAMQPDFAFELESEESARRLRAAVERLTDDEGASLFAFKESGATLNLNLRPSPRLLATKTLRIGALDAPKQPLTLDDAGMAFFVRDQGTGYHQPRGILLAWPQATPDDGREEIPLETVAPSLLALFGTTPESYMSAFVTLW